MCGLTGIAGNQIYKGDLAVFQDLLYLSAFRGKHSTGVAAIKNKGRVLKLHKHAITPAEFIQNYGGEKGYLSDSYYDIFIGHARWATAGAVTEANAHPFETAKYVGAHNGTLCDRRFLSDRSGKTDSELMFQEMDEKGIVETLSSLSVASAWAVSIWDKKTGKLWLGRNAKRPLYVAFVKRWGMMFWSSELEMLRFVESREDEKTWGLEFECFSLRPNHLYEIDVNKIDGKNWSPWKVHELPAKTTSITTVPKAGTTDLTERKSVVDETFDDGIDWSQVMGGHFEDFENQYVWDRKLNCYVPAKKDRQSAVADLLDEVEADIKESMRSEAKSILI